MACLACPNYLDFHVIYHYHDPGETKGSPSMKTRVSLLPVASFLLLILSIISTCRGSLVTFDDISNIGTGTFVNNGYEGLNWINLSPLNAILRTNFNLDGYYYGMISASNVAYNAFGNPAEIDAAGTNFNFLNVYLTGAWRSNLNIEVQGFRSGNFLYDQTVVASATSSTLFAFNYFNIDRLTFNSFGGEYAGFGSTAEQFAMDNFTFEFVPEPSSLLLATFGALLLCPLLKRKKACHP